MLILKYERIDIFHNRVYTEDKQTNPTKEDLKKAFSFFNINHDSAIQIDDTVIFWDSLTDYENRIATARHFDHLSYSEVKESYEKAKKEAYSLMG